MVEKSETRLRYEYIPKKAQELIKDNEDVVSIDFLIEKMNVALTKAYAYFVDGTLFMIKFYIIRGTLACYFWSKAVGVGTTLKLSWNLNSDEPCEGLII